MRGKMSFVSTRICPLPFEVTLLGARIRERVEVEKAKISSGRTEFATTFLPIRATPTGQKLKLFHSINGIPAAVLDVFP